MKEALELAVMVVKVLDAQKKYFKTRDRFDLIKSKDLEKELRQMAEGLLAMKPRFET